MTDAGETLRYPIGRFKAPEHVSADDRARWIDEIAQLPLLLHGAVEDLSDGQLETPYRPGGWTIRQVVHHLADSHMNAYIRFRLALTEDTPTIKPYDESAWAELVDARGAPQTDSLDLVRSLHRRWIRLLRSMDEDAWARAFDHPESGEYPLTRALAQYAWHGKHHLAHITSLRQRKKW